MKTYTTIQGDMWDSIAYSQFGSSTLADKLMNANQKYVGYFIFPAGIQILIPDLDRAKEVQNPPWRDSVG